MLRDSRFWILMVVFQAFFGFAVFAITRDYYRQETPRVRAHAGTLSPAASSWQGISETDISRLAPSIAGDSAPQDPAAISRQADEYFSRKQYEQAASRYRQLLDVDPTNVEVHNNLGLTLHYLGRSDEALGYLDKGVALDPTHQRIWLTLGYISSQRGDMERARRALDKAMKTGDDESIRQSAERMLAELP